MTDGDDDRELTSRKSVCSKPALSQYSENNLACSGVTGVKDDPDTRLMPASQPNPQSTSVLR